MFPKVFPEEVGISSQNVLEYIKYLEKRGLHMHSVIMARGNKIFTECYWKPFNDKSLHRMYSATKSYVGIAVSQLAAEGKISLDDKIIDYFPESQPDEIHEYFKFQTIRNMLTMQTCVENTDWFKENIEDRVEHYFALKPCRPPQTSFYYDSEGSFVLGALVEKITGKNFLDYLRSKCLDEIGFSKEAYCLKAPGGYAWGDSALLATPIDMLLFGRLIAQKGKWNGKQLLDENAVAEAIKKQTDNYSATTTEVSAFNNMGYGYQIWRCFNNSFAFCGMHSQFVIYDADTDITFVCTAGNPMGASNHIIIEGLFNYIIDRADNVISEDKIMQNKLVDYINQLKLYALKGNAISEFEKTIAAKTFTAEPNPMGITSFSFHFDKDNIIWRYKNKQGEKELSFGRNKNNFCDFPQTGYSNKIGGKSCDGHTYFCAVSATWKEDKKLSLLVQVIDEYIGVLNVTVSFADDKAFITMYKHAENFMDEYMGNLTAKTDLK